MPRLWWTRIRREIENRTTSKFFCTAIPWQSVEIIEGTGMLHREGYEAWTKDRVAWRSRSGRLGVSIVSETADYTW